MGGGFQAGEEPEQRLVGLRLGGAQGGGQSLGPCQGFGEQSGSILRTDCQVADRARAPGLGVTVPWEPGLWQGQGAASSGCSCAPGPPPWPAEGEHLLPSQRCWRISAK